jgi:hypothetical protein
MLLEEVYAMEAGKDSFSPVERDKEGVRIIGFGVEVRPCFDVVSSDS